MFYVFHNDVSTFKLAAEITSPAGATFRTNTPDPSPGKFDSWVNIQGVQPPLYGHTDLKIERVNEVTNSHWDVDLYYIKFAESDLRIVDSLHVDVGGDGAHVMKMPVLASPRMHIAFQVGERRTVSFVGASSSGVQFVVNQREGQATAARCTYTGLTGYYPETRWVKACVWYINQYGNTVKCSLSNTYTDDYNTIWLEGVEHG